MAEKIYRAGLIPVYIDSDKEMHMLFMQPSDTRYGGSDYQIAKGRIEEDEEPYDTAIREAGEELGLRPDNMTDVYDCGRWLGRTYFYVAIVADKEDFGDFHFETASTKWMTPMEFAKNGRDIHREVVRHATNIVEMATMYTDI